MEHGQGQCLSHDGQSRMKWKSLARALALTLLGSVALFLLIGVGVTVTRLAGLYFATKRAYSQVILLNDAQETISQGEVRALGKHISSGEHHCPSVSRVTGKMPAMW